MRFPIPIDQVCVKGGGAGSRGAPLPGYAFEREDALDCGTINDLAKKVSAGGYTITDMIADLTQAQSFRVRATDGVTQ